MSCLRSAPGRVLVEFPVSHSTRSAAHRLFVRCTGGDLGHPMALPLSGRGRGGAASGAKVGHVNTDLDSVAGAIGAANLYGGIPLISEHNLNGEILFALKEAGLERPMQYDDYFASLPDQEARDAVKVCLVDHTVSC